MISERARELVEKFGDASGELGKCNTIVQIAEHGFPVCDEDDAKRAFVRSADEYKVARAALETHICGLETKRPIDEVCALTWTPCEGGEIAAIEIDGWYFCLRDNGPLSIALLLIDAKTKSEIFLDQYSFRLVDTAKDTAARLLRAMCEALVYGRPDD